MIVSATFLWIGFVCAISFLEAWLKFQAPGVTLAIGLGIGRLVFGVLNKVEWVLAIAVLAALVISKAPLLRWQNLLFLLPLILLLAQSFWLLPQLDQRALMHIREGNVASSNLHFYYVGAEVIKVGCLLVFGVRQFNESTDIQTF
jgi:hypothetical protein